MCVYSYCMVYIVFTALKFSPSDKNANTPTHRHRRRKDENGGDSPIRTAQWRKYTYYFRQAKIPNTDYGRQTFDENTGVYVFIIK